MNYLNDKEFLKQLDSTKNKHIYARITSLSLDELPQQTIEGKVTQGSINVDGSSAVRRTCSLTLVTQTFDYQDYYWAYKTKFRLEIGIENFINSNYPPICWFKQGIYIITSLNTSQSTNNFTMTIQGKDKMCLLNGEVSGSLEAQTDFGKIEQEDGEGNWTIRSLPIQEIIRNILHQYAGEPYHNIIINDLETYGLELLEYRYDLPLYMVRSIGTNEYTNIIFNRECKYEDQNNELDNLPAIAFDALVETLHTEGNEGQDIELDEEIYRIAKLEYGDTAGYRITDLVYAGDLIANIGESLTSILDKIKNMLVEFEYFYDIDGRFIFQKKQSFLNTIWTPGSNYNDQIEDFQGLSFYSSYIYKFQGGELITAFNNNPNLANARNDYSIWGERTGVSGAKIPIHLRYAIDSKPHSYTTIKVEQEMVDEYNNKYGTDLKVYDVHQYTDANWDWREIIYQMALDYFRYNWLEDFELRVAQANPNLYPSGRTGYEQYYTDIQGFWREIYNPDIDKSISEVQTEQNKTEEKLNSVKNSIDTLSSDLSEKNNYLQGLKAEIQTNILNSYNSTTEDRHKQLITILDQQKTATKIQYEIEELQRQKANLENEQAILQEKANNLKLQLEALEEDRINYNYENTNDNRQFWHKNVFEAPETLNFWFDFLDSEGELSQISVSAVGSRSKAVNDSNIKSIYYRDTPSIIYTENIQNKDKELINIPYRYVQIDNIEEMFTISAQGKSAKEKLDELLYQHGYLTESISITCLPIYYLQPNTRIYIYDDKTNIDGEYVLSKITIPLTYNGTMSLTATKAAEQLI